MRPQTVPFAAVFALATSACSRNDALASDDEGPIRFERHLAFSGPNPWVFLAVDDGRRGELVRPTTQS